MDMNTHRVCETSDFITREQTAQSSLYSDCLGIFPCNDNFNATVQSVKEHKKKKKQTGCFQLKIKLVIIPKTQSCVSSLASAGESSYP